MRILPHNEIDCELWDALVATQEKGPYDYSWYLDAVTSHWYVYVDEDYSKGFAFAASKRLGVQNVTIAPFVREHQFYGEWNSSEIEAAFYLIQLHFKGGVHQSDKNIGKKERTYQIVRELKLDNHAKRNIQKAIKNGISVRETSDFETSLHVVLTSLERKMHDFNNEKQIILKRLIRILALNKRLITLEIVKEEQVIGGLFFFKGKERNVYLKGGATEEGKKLGGMYLAMAFQIEETLAQGKLFDFDGSEVPGVKRFNQYFNTEDETYYQYAWDKNAWWYHTIRNIYVKLKR